jgi:Polyketide cyclase / dehydrase and lipid transport
MSQRLVPVTVHQTATASPEVSFDVTAPIDLTLIFTGYGPLPSVVGIREQTGAWDHVGVSRRPVLSDGTATFEQVTDYNPPSGFAYEVSGFTNILGRFVHGARGSWTFSPTAQGGTLIEWTYGFRPKRFRSLATRLLIVPIWRPYMRRALAATVREVHRRSNASNI